MQCSYFDAHRCSSCTLMGTPYPQQVSNKDALSRQLLVDALGSGIDGEWERPYTGPEAGFRNKAKMVVGGTSKKPTLGILDADGHGIDLRRCGVVDPAIAEVLPLIATFIRVNRIQPYHVPTRRGELKHVIVTANPDGQLMIRFVVRSQQGVDQVRGGLPGLLERLPQALIVTANLLPNHIAALEGEREVHLHGPATLPMRVNDVTLRLRPQGFFQTNTDVAAALYAQAQEWIAEVAPASVWDLYCGVGGFALHAAAPGRVVTGIEISEGAIEGAGAARERAIADGVAGASDVHFAVGDAGAWAMSQDHAADLVLVNPPRRGIGADLAGWLERCDAEHVIYSSCNATTLAKDLAAMPSWNLKRVRVMDMFPQTDHFEVITLLSRRR
ncbi:MAG: methyltransferase domain-containing protein [Galactobacter sp.]|uniref:methyltransferase domain-containing protein n=1 Tax=Galactobacter sp. TaxID=2676125 RepID=UPI0025C5F6D0|nr:methyltransferase domain-containing protein [Galactobacter sp.]